ncbi:MAG: nicotinate-nucleotide--dimethylbenzimidazole phosphoribosyltransferase [Huintestinicola sp.]
MERIKGITPSDKNAAQRAQDKWNGVAKPLHGLGLLEDAVIKLAAVYGTEKFDIKKRCAVCICADNGVVCEGVSQTGSEVTALVARAVAEGTSNINLMAKSCGADCFAVDMGILENIDCDGLINMKIANGTGNIAKGPAMTAEQARKAVSSGMDIVKMCRDKGYRMIVSGEMGIGNTTTTAAVASVLLGLPPSVTAGRGAGLDSAGLERKKAVIERAIEVNAPDKTDPMDILAKLGGFDIAGITGLFLGGAYYKVPVIIDGVISAAAAVLAARICPAAAEYMLCSHVSEEPAAKILLNELNMTAPITAGLHLGEGTGAVLLLPMLDAAMAVYDSSHIFDNLPMERYVELK